MGRRRHRGAEAVGLTEKSMERMARKDFGVLVEKSVTRA